MFDFYVLLKGITRESENDFFFSGILRVGHYSRNPSPRVRDIAERDLKCTPVCQ